ncbi:tRNA adenosine(34) deaminase TadA [uncultured Anaerovibrio sp.]|uniref:tRNA adenosine(34) deaminase TadA n=1 Tax=uncultured Anaerovibrio sp. TaxID=361586 RepID=UPI0025D2C86A|nr:tRNA adenosine(34) deaminase TadA [uncultured Anaerovibrio sp.]
MVLDDEKFMHLALAEAEKAYELGEVPIGAVLVDEDGTVVSVGHNLRERDKDATAHAEMEAIRAANKRLDRWRLSGTTLYVTIEPCPMCAGAIVNSRIDRVVYGGADVKAGAVHSIFNVLTNPNLNHQVEVTAGVLEDECAGIMKRFFKFRRQQNKEKKVRLDINRHK